MTTTESFFHFIGCAAFAMIAVHAIGSLIVRALNRFKRK